MNPRRHARPSRVGKTTDRAHRQPIPTQESAGTWRQIHAIMDEITPLGTDCGLLCGARCCDGGPQDGMLLFPGEETLYQGTSLPNNWVVRDSGIRLPISGESIRILVCTGICERARRPLACRVFPLLPRVDARGGIRVSPDLRALSTCPLLYDKASPRIRPAFVRGVEEVFTKAAAIHGVLELLTLLQEENREIRRFFR